MEGPAEIVYCYVKEEHPDNIRFKKDCEKWFGQEIKVISNEKYNGSIYEVFEKRNYLVGVAGAPCTRLLKKEIRKNYELPSDRQVFGYTIEEQDRVDRFIDANNNVNLWSILIEKNLTKEDCLATAAHPLYKPHHSWPFPSSQSFRRASPAATRRACNSACRNARPRPTRRRLF